MSEKQDNAAIYFAYDVNDTLHRYMKPSVKKMRADKGTSKAEVHAACKTLMQAMENASDGGVYAASVHAASIIGTYAINHGDRDAAYDEGRKRSDD